MVASKCEVCQEKLSKYKCPKCTLKYCSVTCYRGHKKVSCESKTENDSIERSFVEKMASQKREATAAAQARLTNGNEKLNDMLPTRGDESEDETDRVPTDKLQELATNDSLRALLQNPHLRKIVEDLDQSTQPAEDLEKAMHEPIFIEFAEECLKTVSPASSSPKRKRQPSPPHVL